MKKFKKLLSFLLCFAMVLSSIPTMAFAADGAGDSGATSKEAKIEFVLLRKATTDEVNAGSDVVDGNATGLVPMTDADFKKLQAYTPTADPHWEGEGRGGKWVSGWEDAKEGINTFYLGVKCVSFEKLPNVSKTITSAGFGVNYNSDFLVVEPKAVYNASSDLNGTKFDQAMKERLQANDWSIVNDTAGGTFSFADTNFAKAKSPKDDSVSALGDNWKQLFASTLYSADSGSDFNGEPDQYLFVYEIGIKAIPTNDADLEVFKVPAVYKDSGFFISYADGGLTAGSSGSDKLENFMEMTANANLNKIFSNGKAPSITGSFDAISSATYGEKITAVFNKTTGENYTPEYQWYVVTTEGANKTYTAIDGATTLEYTPNADVVGKTICVKATPSAADADSFGGEKVSNEVTVEKATLTLPTADKITGVSTSKLDVEPANDVTTEYTYTFKTEQGIKGSDVVTAKFNVTWAKGDVTSVNTSNTEDAVFANADGFVTLEGANKDCYKIEAANDAAATVAGVAAPINDKDPVVGSVTLDKTAPVYGDTITATPAITSETPGELTYKWYYDGTNEIAGQNAATLTIDKTLVGKTITCKVSAANYSGTADSAATTAVAKKTLTPVAATFTAEGITTVVGTADVTGKTVNMTTADGLVGSDVVTLTYKATFADATTPKTGVALTITWDLDALSGTDAACYTVPAQAGLTGATGEVLADPIKNVTAKDSLAASYTALDDLDLTAINVNAFYQSDDSTAKDAALSVLPAHGFKFYLSDDGTWDGADTELTVKDNKIEITGNMNTKHILVYREADKPVAGFTAVTADLGALTVNKATPTLTIKETSQTIAQLATMPAVTVKVGEKEVTGATTTVQVYADKVTVTETGTCTCEGGATKHDKTKNPSCTYEKTETTTQEWMAWNDEDAQKFIKAKKVGDKIQVFPSVAATDDLEAIAAKAANGDTTGVQEITVKSASTGGGGGGGGGSRVSKYTVSFDAGKNGKITDGKTSVSVEKDQNVAKADVPTVTAKEGYKFIGWSLDGKTVVDPTAAKVTAKVTYTALYKETKGLHEAYMKGDEKGNFNPNADITRAEAAALIARLVPAYNEQSTYTGSLPDVTADAWYFNEVSFDVEKGYITGYEDGTFRPENSITRQEFCIIVAKYLGLTNEGTSNFADVNGVFAEGYITQLVEKGIVEGMEDGTFRPNANITRAEATKILNGVFDRTPDVDTLNANIEEYDVALKDVPAKHWAYYEILEAALEHEITDFHK